MYPQSRASPDVVCAACTGKQQFCKPSPRVPTSVTFCECGRLNPVSLLLENPQHRLYTNFTLNYKNYHANSRYLSNNCPGHGTDSSDTHPRLNEEIQEGILMDKKLLFLAAFMVGFVLVVPASAAIGISPGSTSTIAGFPVTQNLTGLTADTSYTVWSTTDGNASQLVFTSDSDGAASITLTPPISGANTYELRLTAGSSSLLSWSVDNLDIMIYLLPMVGLMITFAIIGAVMKSVKF